MHYRKCPNSFQCWQGLALGRLGQLLGGWQWRADRSCASRCGHSLRRASGLTGDAFVGATSRRIDNQSGGLRSPFGTESQARDRAPHSFFHPIRQPDCALGPCVRRLARERRIKGSHVAEFENSCKHSNSRLGSRADNGSATATNSRTRARHQHLLCDDRAWEPPQQGL
jgi:hypothetical protein